MYLDWRLWSFTRGVRLRIAGTVALGLLQVMAGIGRLALLGWLLARVFRGASLESLAVPILMTAAVIVVRGGLEYARAMIAHRTTAIVQARLRQTIYDRVVALGPAHFTRARTGEVIVSMVEGVQQLETYFGQYLPQLAVAALTPIVIFAFVAFLDLPIALVLLVAALVTLVAPTLQHRKDSRASLARSKAYRTFAADFLDSIQGLSASQAIYTLLDAQPSVRDDATPTKQEPLTPIVAFESVTFSYPGGRRPAHEGLTFVVAPGERVGVVGPSGAGKSTVARLLLR